LFKLNERLAKRVYILGQAKPFMASGQAMPILSMALGEHQDRASSDSTSGKLHGVLASTIPHLRSAIKHRNISDRLQTFTSSC
jgi:hypothetical protein